jgi:hypothetical protein
MSSFWKKAIGFWFVLLLIALVNATIRETTYKPWLTPYIGMWAHQISSVIGIAAFYGAIYYFLKKSKDKYSRRDLIGVGAMWMTMTILFECFMNFYFRKLSISEVIQTYYFWRGELWIIVLLSLIVSPQIVWRRLKGKN